MSLRCGGCFVDPHGCERVALDVAWFSEVDTMCKEIWSEMRYLDDECGEGRRSLSGLELTRLEYLAEHPELENPVLDRLPEVESLGWGR